ncbi:Methionine--tRNA ligase [Mesomycoplasma conjunctivae]|uniref:Methionine--tRNA ligase n=1 Tax=Mesomycoplasma conjunctivae (strain ATCC 25834 / NCTC 10147 / HRC/581) TaxID=572263 RepID=C5J6B9_MESCH|nr:methionine--tRNA ligase [Mesomycoplasma conjunctivae]CAT05011.1 Methionyl-tRNA synthetase [Mesomycoplasma conjunctivae]VEU66330.1 Methionine--tRNA ligase [Mesomycoplasma conjunctivae]
MSKKRFYVTTPIYYASGNLHIGHLYTTTIAWVIKNYKKLQGYDARLLTGSDEHGQKIFQKAQENQLEPQFFVDQVANKFKNLWEIFEIDYDYFSRTTSDFHKEYVSKIFDEMLAKGFIFKDFYKGLYSVSDEEFLTPKQAIKKDDGYYHPVSGSKMEYIEEESFFFDMKKMQSWLLDFWKNHPQFISEKKIENELIKNFLEKGIENLSVTRTSLEWGIPVKSQPGHVIYVWLDALFNYISALKPLDKNSDFDTFWNQSEQIVHVVGKEITRFHCIYWPIFLQSLNLRLPSNIITHGWLITPEGKMSKSKGNVVDPLELIKKHDVETIKLFFASQIILGQDGIFDEHNLNLFYNSTLANNFGNLISRTIAMINKNFDTPLIYNKELLDENDVYIYKQIEQTHYQFIDLFDNLEVDKALKLAISLSKNLNSYIDIQKPWLISQKEKLSVVLLALLNGIYAVNTMFSVVMPKNSKKILAILKQKSISLQQNLNFSKFDKTIFEKAEIIYPRLKLD